MARRVPWGSIKVTREREVLDRADGFSFGVLGPLVVTSPDGPVTMPMGRERAVLAQLLARVGQPVSVDVLVDGLWPATPPASAERTLHAHVARLRSRLEPGRAARQRGLIVTSARGYLLDADVATVDAGRFEALVDRAARGAGDPADLRTALQLWRGRAYDGFDDVELCAQEGRRLDALRLAAIELRNDAELALGPDVALIAELEALVVEHPLRERFWEQLMLGLYRVGRQSEALAAYKRARRTLIDDMGVEPGPALRHLEAAILDHDVGLLSPRRARPPRSLPIDLDAHGQLLTGRDEELVAVDAYWTAAVGRPGRLRRPARSGGHRQDPPGVGSRRPRVRQRRHRAVRAVRPRHGRAAPALRCRAAEPGIVGRRDLTRARWLGCGRRPASRRVAW